MSRTKHLRERLQWSQQRMADYLGVAQSAISRLENGQAERGPVARLLDQIERDFPAVSPGGPSDVPVTNDKGSPHVAGASRFSEAAE